jgi:hypothetical protein
VPEESSTEPNTQSLLNEMSERSRSHKKPSKTFQLNYLQHILVIWYSVGLNALSVINTALNKSFNIPCPV